MKSMILTEKHKSKLLEMCKALFPKYRNIYFNNKSNEHIGFGIKNKLNHIYTDYIYIHWFEFCITKLCPKLTNCSAMFDDIESDDIKIVQHPVDYLYKKYKQKFPDEIVREIVTKDKLSHDDVRQEVNKILTNLFKEKQKELEEMLEETCEVNSPITYGYYHGGIDSTYYFSTIWGTVKAYIGDEDYKVEYLPNMSLKLVSN